ncbi:hypothetical protein A374_14230 [Fictibacillus macauensis ZFHKF-1]|uniref:Uncharacterized protein n=1 Tax=Fictibacillus macauensis ZFHKF-1 TaxID=1196324 RepID=I8IZD2_9BACL|nr:hypothetical protein [Fictibacillus macauensis]EIT84856.1 hypothetical protein A374_14230 [Fictibacillus macauensis ZFHKF-1]
MEWKVAYGRRICGFVFDCAYVQQLLCQIVTDLNVYLLPCGQCAYTNGNSIICPDCIITYKFRNKNREMVFKKYSCDKKQLLLTCTIICGPSGLFYCSWTTNPYLEFTIDLFNDAIAFCLFPELFGEPPEENQPLL